MLSIYIDFLTLYTNPKKNFYFQYLNLIFKSILSLNYYFFICQLPYL